MKSLKILRSLEDLTIEANKHIAEAFSGQVYKINSYDVKYSMDLYGQSPLEVSIRRNLKENGFKNPTCYLSYSNGKIYLTLTIDLNSKNRYIMPFEVKPSERLLMATETLKTSCMDKIDLHSSEKKSVAPVRFGFHSTETDTYTNNEPCILDLDLSNEKSNSIG